MTRSLGFSEEWGRWDWEGDTGVHLFSKYTVLSTQYLEGHINRMKQCVALKEFMVLLGQQNTSKYVNANGVVDK